MIDLDADGTGVNATSFARVFAVVFEFGRGARTKEAERIEIAFEVSPLAVGGENSFAFGIGAVVAGRGHRGGAGNLCLRHMSALLG